ncbi:MAG: hypothetical protein ACPHV3_05270 [Vibrio sp.]
MTEQTKISTLAELEAFLMAVENGSFGLSGVAGVGMATRNTDGGHFVAVFGDNHTLLLAQDVTDEVFETGKDLVRLGPKRH